MPFLRTSVRLRDIYPQKHGRVNSNILATFSNAPGASVSCNGDKSKPMVMQARCTPYRTLFVTSILSFASRSSTLAMQLRERWEANDDPLWWACGTASKQKQILRSTMSRKGRQAFIQVLKEKGFSQDGRRIAGHESAQLGYDLAGTIQLTVMPLMISTPFAVVKDQTRAMVNQMISAMCNAKWEAMRQRGPVSSKRGNDDGQHAPTTTNQ